MTRFVPATVRIVTQFVAPAGSSDWTLYVLRASGPKRTTRFAPAAPTPRTAVSGCVSRKPALQFPTGHTNVPYEKHSPFISASSPSVAYPSGRDRRTVDRLVLTSTTRMGAPSGRSSMGIAKLPLASETSYQAASAPPFHR